jgi:dUTP pyrophosphatase
MVTISVIAQDKEFLPVYSSDLAAGADVKACIQEDLVIEAGASALIPTGLKLSIPEGYEIQVRPRSGLALKQQITVLNTPGTIDADYRGEVGVILINHGKQSFIVSRGMRIAQLVLARVAQAQYQLVDELSVTLRGVGGFGHTGTH